MRQHGSATSSTANNRYMYPLLIMVTYDLCWPWCFHSSVVNPRRACAARVTVGDFLFDVHFSNLVSERQSSKVQKFKVRADGFVPYSF